MALAAWPYPRLTELLIETNANGALPIAYDALVSALLFIGRPSSQPYSLGYLQRDLYISTGITCIVDTGIVCKRVATLRKESAELDECIRFFIDCLLYGAAPDRKIVNARIDWGSSLLPQQRTALKGHLGYLLTDGLLNLLTYDCQTSILALLDLLEQMEVNTEQSGRRLVRKERSKDGRDVPAGWRG